MFNPFQRITSVPVWWCMPSGNFCVYFCVQTNGNFPAHYNSDDLHSGKATSAPLDHNHTHFILVDNGTENKFGVEIALRATLEQYISEVVQTGVSENQSELRDYTSHVVLAPWHCINVFMTFSHSLFLQ